MVILTLLQLLLPDCCIFRAGAEPGDWEDAEKMVSRSVFKDGNELCIPFPPLATKGERLTAPILIYSATLKDSNCRRAILSRSRDHLHMEEGREERTSPEPDQWFAKEKLYKVNKLILNMGDFTQGGECLLKNVPIFSYGKIQYSINKSIDGLQPTCSYQLRVSRGPHNAILGHALVELV